MQSDWQEPSNTSSLWDNYALCRNFLVRVRVGLVLWSDLDILLIRAIVACPCEQNIFVF